MTKEEWLAGPRHLLLSGWPSSIDTPLDDGAYAFLLERFSMEEVNEAIRSMLGARFTPKPSEIVAEVLKKRPAITLAPVAAASDEVIAKRAWMDEVDRRETARRDAELDEWWENEATEEQKAAGEAWLAAHGLAPITEEIF